MQGETIPSAPIRRHPHKTLSDLTGASLQRRGPKTFSGLTYRYLQVYVIQPVTEGFSALDADLDAAYVSYLRALKSIKADHPPLFRLRFTYGKLQLTFTCANPLNLESVQEAIGLLLFSVKMFWAAYCHIAFWSVKAGVFFMVFTVVPEMAGGQNIIA
ncbi:MAG: hypothetical protein Q9191_007296 [Dirinaria sp. TL-2023a]